MALHEKDFLHLLHEAFGQEKANKFPDALVKAMRGLCDETYRKGFAARAPDIDQFYDQGFTEGWDSGCRQAFVDIHGDQTDIRMAHELMAGLANRHREAWRKIAKANYDNCTGQIFRKKEEGRFGWRVVNEDGRVMAISEQTFSTELGAKIEAKQVTGMPFL